MITVNNLDTFIDKINGSFGIVVICLIVGVVLLSNYRKIQSFNKFLSLICQICIVALFLAGISGLFVIGFIHFRAQITSNPEPVTVTEEKNVSPENISPLNNDALQREFAGLQEDYLRLTQEKSTLEKRLFDATKSDSENQKKLQDSRNEIIKLSKENSELEKNINSLSLEINTLKSQNLELDEKLKPMTANVEKLQSENKKLRAEISELQDKVASYSNLQKEFLALQENYLAISKAKNDFEHDVKKLTLENTSLNSDNFKLTQKLNAVTVSFDNLQAENNSLRLENKALRNNINVSSTENLTNEVIDYMKDSKAFNGHHYKVFNVSNLWWEAKQRCEEMGGHLCTINSFAEFDFITTLLNPDDEYWLGASDADHEGEWKWVTGEPFSITKWAPTWPAGLRNQNFLLLSHQKYFYKSTTWYWYDGKNNATVFFICEWDF